MFREMSDWWINLGKAKNLYGSGKKKMVVVPLFKKDKHFGKLVK